MLSTVEILTLSRLTIRSQCSLRVPPTILSHMSIEDRNALVSRRASRSPSSHSSGEAGRRRSSCSTFHPCSPPRATSPMHQRFANQIRGSRTRFCHIRPPLQAPTLPTTKAYFQLEFSYLYETIALSPHDDTWKNVSLTFAAPCALYSGMKSFLLKDSSIQRTLRAA